MPIYAVISHPDPSADDDLATVLGAMFTENDLHEVIPGMRVIRSPLLTSTQVRDALGIKNGVRTGVVFAIDSGRCAGVWDSDFVEKFQVWQSAE